MSKPFEYPNVSMDRGKVLHENDLEELKGNWGRYLDKDGDGIPYRTLPGNKHPMSSYFTRGTGHDEYAKYTEDAVVFQRNMERLKKKFETAKQYVPKPVVFNSKNTNIAIMAYGSTEAAINEARAQLENDHGIKTDFMRVRAFPFSPEVDEFVKNYDQIFVVEMNRDGQLHQLLSLAHPEFAMKFKSVAFGDGMPASAKWMREGILAKYTKPEAIKTAQKVAVKKKVAAKKLLGKKAAPKKSAAQKTVKTAKRGMKGAK
jgi:2-oxoglutarate ferredoxin oxidoreductase subunit alpha